MAEAWGLTYESNFVWESEVGGGWHGGGEISSLGVRCFTSLRHLGEWVAYCYYSMQSCYYQAWSVGTLEAEMGREGPAWSACPSPQFTFFAI